MTTTTNTTSRLINCHRCGRNTKTRGTANVVARHKPMEGFWADYQGMCAGSGENPCLAVVGEHHQHPCKPF
jgi:hypothetical protein